LLSSLLSGTLASSSRAADESTDDTKPKVAVTGWVETFYQWNFNRPSNRITNLRGFDVRHDTFSLQTAALDVVGTADRVTAHVTLQYGLAPETYYLAEPSHEGAGTTPPSNASVWKYLQQANIGWKAPIGNGLLLEMGLFVSPIGPEGLAVKDQWNWSRSNLFFGLPFYHSGARATYAVSDAASVTAHVYNGWNNVVDNNHEKSIALSFLYSVTDRVTFQALYFGGNERPKGALEGKPWRNLFDAYVTIYPNDRIALSLHGDAGFEKNTFGSSSWAAVSGSARVKVVDWMYLAARGDYFQEHLASNSEGTASAIFWPSEWVSSTTGTIDLRPADRFSVRLEYRHDLAQGPSWFKNDVATDALGAFIPNTTSQTTFTVGASAWF